jgi:hypothetical protein
MIEIKKWYQSKTIWLAIIQAVIGITVAVMTHYDLIAYIAVVKSLGDVFLRYLTEQPVG